MAHAKNLRHVEALLEEIVAEPSVEGTLKKGLEAFLSALMESEVTEVAGAPAPHGAREPARVAHRNGYRDRKFQTGLGSHELRIPKLRQGTYLPSFLKSRQRSDDSLLLAVAACYHQGVSTRNVEKVAQALGVESLKKSTVSNMVAKLDPQVRAFRERQLGCHPYVFLDARYENVREDHAVRKVAVLVALGVRDDGAREVLGYGVARVENETYWRDFIADLVHRGLSGVRLVVSDAHEGLRRAIEKGLPAANWQRCKVHFLRNLGARIPRKQRPAFLALAKTVFAFDTREEAEKQRTEVAKVFRQAGRADAAEFLERSDEVLTYLDFPLEHHTKLHSTNMVERLNRELKRRTRVVSIFPNRRSLERLVGALLLEEHEEWLVARRYISERSMKKLLTPYQQIEQHLPGAGGLLVAK
jgi:transposase-like protein